MKKPVLAAIIVAAVVLVVGVVAAWLAFSSTPNATNTEPTITYTDMTGSKEVKVVMRDISFSPANIKVKKGTTVTWTNEDTVAHNVVAADATNTGGLPTSSATFGRGGTFSMTFKNTGTFKYLCVPHKEFMKGAVQVVD